MTEIFEIRVTKINRPLVGPMTQETLYLAKPTTAPDPGAIIAAFNPTLTLPLPPPTKLETEVAVAELGATANLTTTEVS